MGILDPSKSFFETLGLSPITSDAAVHAAYKTLARKVHPDKQGRKEDMQLLNHIKCILKTPAGRAEYSEWLVERDDRLFVLGTLEGSSPEQLKMEFSAATCGQPDEEETTDEEAQAEDHGDQNDQIDAEDKKEDQGDQIDAEKKMQVNESIPAAASDDVPNYHDVVPPHLAADIPPENTGTSSTGGES